jgi:hypothetical protein
VKKLLGRIKAFANSVVENAKVRKRMIAVPIYHSARSAACAFGQLEEISGEQFLFQKKSESFDG